MIKSLAAVILILVTPQTAIASQWQASFCEKITKYDHIFESYTRQYLPAGFDWKIIKAISCAESNLDNNAVSHVGAQTLMQIMPATWSDVTAKFGWSRHVEKSTDRAIRVGVVYFDYLRRSWSSKRSEDDRNRLASASYNAGLGNILKAQKKCNNAIKYDDIIYCLPDITGDNSKETISYVDKIYTIYDIWKSK